VVFHPTKLPAPLFPWWPSATVITTIFLIGEQRITHDKLLQCIITVMVITAVVTSMKDTLGLELAALHNAQTHSTPLLACTLCCRSFHSHSFAISLILPSRLSHFLPAFRSLPGPHQLGSLGLCLHHWSAPLCCLCTGRVPLQPHPRPTP
jgi:hypothetical protein